MKKIVSLMLLAFCLFACNSMDKKISELEKACDANDLEKAEAIYESIDASDLTLKQTARWTEVTMKYSALKTQQLMEEAAKQTQQIMEQSAKQTQELMEQSAKQMNSLFGN